MIASAASTEETGAGSPSVTKITICRLDPPPAKNVPACEKAASKLVRQRQHPGLERGIVVRAHLAALDRSCDTCVPEHNADVVRTVGIDTGPDLANQRRNARLLRRHARARHRARDIERDIDRGVRDIGLGHDGRLLGVPLRRTRFARQHAGHANGPWLQIRVDAEIDLPQHEAAEPAIAGHVPIHPRSQIVVLPLGWPAHQYIDIADNAPFAALTAEEVGLVDADTPTPGTCVAGGAGRLEHLDRLRGEAQRLGQDGPGGHIGGGDVRDPAQRDSLARTIRQLQPVVPADAHPRPRPRKGDRGAGIARQRRSCRHACNRADPRLHGSTTARDAAAGRDRPCGATVHEDLADGINRPMAERQMHPQRVAEANGLRLATPAHRWPPLPFPAARRS
jgi:hypothetical protein